MQMSIYTLLQLKLPACREPGSMMRGKKQILKKGAKQSIEDYFGSNFPIQSLWENPTLIANKYEQWHRKVSRGLIKKLKTYMGADGNTTEAVAAKLLDTYMHQLMKYSELQIIWSKLHLPLDRTVFQELSKRHICFIGKEKIANFLKKKKNQPYSINRKEYEQIQASLMSYLKKLRLDTGIEWSSRIELNWLWI